MKDLMFSCFSKSYFGFPCPGCGGQRAAILLFHGEIWKSFLMYPGLFPLLIFGMFFSLNLFLKKRVLAHFTHFFAVLTAVVIFINYFIKLYQIFL
jgi:hypothetical protein